MESTETKIVPPTPLEAWIGPLRTLQAFLVSSQGTTSPVNEKCPFPFHRWYKITNMNIVPYFSSTFSFDVLSIRQSKILLIVPRTPFVLLTVCAFNIQVYKEAAENHFSLVSSNALQSYYGVDYHFGTFKTQVLSPSLIIFQSVRAGWNNLKLEPSRLRKGIVPR